MAAFEIDHLRDDLPDAIRLHRRDLLAKPGLRPGHPVRSETTTMLRTPMARVCSARGVGAAVCEHNGGAPRRRRRTSAARWCLTWLASLQKEESSTSDRNFKSHCRCSSDQPFDVFALLVWIVFGFRKLSAGLQVHQYCEPIVGRQFDWTAGGFQLISHSSRESTWIDARRRSTCHAETTAIHFAVSDRQSNPLQPSGASQ